MIVKFSRHAKRRAKLYNISESEIEEMLIDLKLKNGVHELTKDFKGFEYPIKMVVSVEDDSMTVVTNYPLKKGRKK